jgi:Zn finger protein HypA/HybF involved in hydrogenase expression
MFGRVYRCSNCPFDFSTGWSHHAGGQLLICPVCGEHYILGAGRSYWGAKDGEQLQLLRGTENKDIPTGVSVTVENVRPGEDEEWDGVSFLRFEDIRCTACAESALVQDLSEGASCPSCHTGVIRTEGTCIY